jgi:hypothetical protein
MKTLKINHAAVWVCVVLSFVLGFIWYGPLFGDPWMQMVGLDRATVEANPPGAGPWITNLVASVLPIYVMAWLFQKMNVTSVMTGAWIGFLISFTFVFLSEMTGDMFAGNPYALSWITGGFTVVIITISGAILGGWTKKVKEGA